MITQLWKTIIVANYIILCCFQLEKHKGTLAYIPIDFYWTQHTGFNAEKKMLVFSILSAFTIEHFNLYEFYFLLFYSQLTYIYNITVHNI